MYGVLRHRNHPYGRAIVFASPSGGGKSTIIKCVREHFPDIRFSVSSTTRPPRAYEVDGVDYDFLSRERFQDYIEVGDFLEFEEVHGDLYGTRKSKILHFLENNLDVIFDLDVLGALSLKRIFPDALLIYLDVTSIDELRKRLELRGTETPESIEKRLQRYRFEREKAEQFDRIIMNDDLETAVKSVIEAIAEYLKEKSLETM